MHKHSSFYVNVLAGGILVLAFVMSFTALTDLGRQAHLSPAWALPLVVDLSTVLGAIASRILAGHPNRLIRVYPLVLVLAWGAVSVWGNAVHASGMAIAAVHSALLGALPGLAIASVVHLLMIMASASGNTAALAQMAARQTAETGAPLIASSATNHSSARTGALPQAGARALSREAVIERIHAYRASQNAWPSSTLVATWQNASTKTAQRLLRRLRETPGS